MLTYENGKRLITAGFNLNLRIKLICLCILFVDWKWIIACGYYIDKMSILLSMAVCIGFYAVWMNKKNIADFYMSVCFGMNVLFNFIRWFGLPRIRIIALILCILGNIYVLLQAKRVKNIPFLSLLLICSFIFQSLLYAGFIEGFLQHIHFIRRFIPYLSQIGLCVCAFLSYAEIRNDEWD